MSSDSGSATDFRSFEDGYATFVLQDCGAMLKYAFLVLRLTLLQKQH